MDWKSRIEENELEIQKYVATVFADRLRQEGFVPKDERGINWYRIAGKDIMQSIHFYTRDTFSNVLLLVGYGIHPLFIAPAYPKRAYIRDLKWDREVFWRQFLKEECECGYQIYSKDIFVSCPIAGGRGIYTFDGILLPIMDAVDSAEKCYLYHKTERENWTFYPYEVRFNNLSQSYIDEAIYAGDLDMYPLYAKSIRRGLEGYDSVERKRGLTTKEIAWMSCCVEQLKVIEGTGRDEYLTMLEERKRKNVAELKKKVGLSVE